MAKNTPPQVAPQVTPQVEQLQVEIKAEMSQLISNKYLGVEILALC